MEKDKNNITLENINNEFLFSENKSNLNILFNRVAFIFFVFIVICVIYLTQTFHLINKNIKKNSDLNSLILKNHRSDIVDTNGQILAKTVLSTSVGINPNSIIDVKKLILKIKLVLPDLDSKVLEEKIKKKKIFLAKKKNRSRKIKTITING